MKNECVYKLKSESNMESDHIVFVDANKNKLECFWFVHDVVLKTNCKNLKFLKKDDEKLFNFFVGLAKQIEKANTLAGGQFIDEGKFTWHSLSRNWNKPIEDEAGFDVAFNNESLEIKFFPSKEEEKYNPSKNKFFISMGGPDGFAMPYQSISDVFIKIANTFLKTIPNAKNIKNIDGNLFI